METIREIMQNYQEVSDLIADAILKRTTPVSDDLSERQAKAAYGTRWINQMKAEGLAESSLIGGKRIYSRHQLDCLRAAQREKVRLLYKQTKDE